MSDFKFIALRNKFRAIPETCRRLDGEQICGSRYHKHQPAHGIVDFIVFIRENETVNLDFLKEKGYNFEFTQMPFIDISSTELRNRIEQGLPINDLVTKEVEEYIYKNELYKDTGMA